MNEIKIKRVYDAVDEHDGYRILADRLWPRGIAKVKADIDLWEKNIAPSAELRKWFGHIPENFPTFTERYIKELEANPETNAFIELCRKQLKESNVTIMFGAKDEVLGPDGKDHVVHAHNSHPFSLWCKSYLKRYLTVQSL